MTASLHRLVCAQSAGGDGFEQPDFRERPRGEASGELRDTADDLRLRGRLYLALFHFQQAAEKGLKAYLQARAKSVELLARGPDLAVRLALQGEFGGGTSDRRTGARSRWKVALVRSRDRPARRGSPIPA